MRRNSASTQSIHKVLIHSRDVMLANDLPLGVLEDAAESCNKLYRHNRQFHARNVSRQHNLMDVFNRALDTSDPIISSFGLQKRLNSRHNRKKLLAEVLRLLKVPDPVREEDETLLLEVNEILDGLEVLCLPADPIHGDDDDEDEEYDDNEDDEEDEDDDDSTIEEDDDGMTY